MHRQILGRHCCSNDTWGREKVSGYVCAGKKGTGWIQAGFRRNATALLATPPWLNFC